MGQVDNEIVFPLLRLPGVHGAPQSTLPHRIQLVLDALHGGGQADGCLIRVGQLFGGSSHLVQVVQGLGNIMIGQHKHPHQNQGASPQNHGGLHGFQKPVQRVLRLPDEQPAEDPCQEDEQGEPRQHPQNA